jgi:hypothetical protein
MRKILIEHNFHPFLEPSCFRFSPCEHVLLEWAGDLQGRRWVDNIRMDLGEVGWSDVDWIGLA